MEPHEIEDAVERGIRHANDDYSQDGSSCGEIIGLVLMVIAFLIYVKCDGGFD